MSVNSVFEKLKEAVIAGDADQAREAIGEALNDPQITDPMRLVSEAIQPAMDIIGSQFESGDCYLPELILAGDAAAAALDLLLPRISDEQAGSVRRGTVVIGSLFGDNHDIGKNIVRAILAANGFKVVDIGINVASKDFVSQARKAEADIIAASTLITTALPYSREIVSILKDSGQREDFFVILGGGPVTPEWTEEIGADGYGRNANDAAVLCKALLDDTKKPPLDRPVIVGALRR